MRVPNRVGWLSRLSIGTKIILPILISVAIGVAALTALVSRSSGDVVRNLAVTSGENLVARIAGKVEGDLRRPLQVAHTLRDTFVRMQRSGVKDRGVYLALMRDVLDSNPDYVGGWMVWDKDGFGALIPDHTQSTPGTTPDGAFSPYAVNHTTGTTVQVLTDYNSASGNYYRLAHATGRDQVLEPYHYVIDGTPHLITSVAVPITVGGRTLGVIGFDVSLDPLNDRFGVMRPYGRGSIAIISQGGLLVAGPAGVKLGEPAETMSKSFAAVKSRVAAGRAFAFDDAGATSIDIFAPARIGDTNATWSVMASLPKAALLAPARQISLFVAGTGLALLAVLAMVVTLLVRGVVTHPTKGLAAAVQRVSSGETDAAVPSTRRGDELGVLARAIELFRHNLIQIAELQRRELAGKEEAEADKRRVLGALAGRFEGEIRHVVDSVAAAASTLSQNADGLAAISQISKTQAASVAVLTGDASASALEVASSSERLTASINEINLQMAAGIIAMQAATQKVTQVGEVAHALASAAARIGGIVQIISAIAGQTNLLALNATIEAARAGATGKGFAVVATEVKMLATQTAKATDEIASQVLEMQTITQSVVAAITEIGAAISRNGDISAAVSAAVQQQVAATSDISASARRAASGTDQAAAAIGGVSRAAAEVGEAAGSMLDSARQLSSSSDQLEKQVGRFVGSLQAR